MESIKEWIDKRSQILLAIFIGIQCVISVIFLIAFFSEGEDGILFKIYSSLLLLIFTVYMVHFAHHSVRYLKC